LSIGYDEKEDMIWLVAKAMVVGEESSETEADDDSAPAVRFVAPRGMMRAMSEHALEVIAAGRPMCPLCGRPIERSGHFCPRSDGQAHPIIF
jgi:uncharacterized repeat protein (TIGR03847 family)